MDAAPLTDPSSAVLSGLLESRCLSMRRMRALINAAGRTELAVLITGETGSGKELVARAIQRASRRSGGPFVPVNCGALPAELIESELFGHRKGAFTGAAGDSPGLFRSAHKGTIFLDEIGEMPLSAQVKLLRVLQQGAVRGVGETREHPVDVRVISATNQDLMQAVKAGTFRLDLFYRINVLNVEVPPLRERIEDLGHLIRCFQGRINGRMRSERSLGFSSEALRALQEHPWPGNLRELENVIEVSEAVASGREVELDDLPPYFRRPEAASSRSAIPRMREMEIRMVKEVLERVAGNKSKAARILGISRSRLYSMLAETKKPQ